MTLQTKALNFVNSDKVVIALGITKTLADQVKQSIEENRRELNEQRALQNEGILNYDA